MSDRQRRGRLAVHAHFYQPDRRDPFSGLIPEDPSAGPERDWTTRIAAECYAPNAQRRNFARIGWDLGPALATWLRRERPEIHAAIQAQENGRNGLAMGYHHSILPLASPRDRRTEIRWGLRDFELRFGHRPAGFWLPETAVDLLTLRIAAEEGVRYTVLAPWQAAADAPETRRPYRVDLGDGREIVVAFYDGELSSAVSFDPTATADADRFVLERVRPRVAAPVAEPALAVIATDGELYGHHQKFRDLFLARLGAWRYPGVEVVTLGAVLADADHRGTPLASAAVREATSWSCHHGLARWSAECADARDGRWKQPLRAALDRLAAAIDVVCEREARRLGVDFSAARDSWVDVASEYAEPDERVERFLADAVNGSPARAARVATDAREHERLEALLSAQASRLAMFASDAWFWEDPSRPETLQALRFAAHAARLLDERADADLERGFVENVRAFRSPLTGQDGSQLYRLALSVVDQAAGVP